MDRSTLLEFGVQAVAVQTHALELGLLEVLDGEARRLPIPGSRYLVLEVQAAAHASDKTSACSSTVCVAFSCLSGG